MPAVKGDGMRGLAVFISDIRNCEPTLLSFMYYYRTRKLLTCQFLEEGGKGQLGRRTDAENVQENRSILFLKHSITLKI